MLPYVYIAPSVELLVKSLLNCILIFKLTDPNGDLSLLSPSWVALPVYITCSKQHVDGWMGPEYKE